MNREIKFRAWDSDNEKMHYSGSMEFIAYDYSIGCCIGITLNEGWKNPYRYSAKLMQYTGLKDKNGKEIYEGDILKAYKPNTYIRGNDLHEIRWHESHSAFAYFNLRVKSFDEGRNGLIKIGENKHGRWCEIVGNIYENPDLI